jgi:hypothetical protein
MGAKDKCQQPMLHAKAKDMGFKSTYTSADTNLIRVFNELDILKDKRALPYADWK